MLIFWTVCMLLSVIGYWLNDQSVLWDEHIAVKIINIILIATGPLLAGFIIYCLIKDHVKQRGYLKEARARRDREAKEEAAENVVRLSSVSRLNKKSTKKTADGAQVISFEKKKTNNLRLV